MTSIVPGAAIPGLSATGKGSKPSNDQVSLRVEGNRFEGWQSVSIKRSIKAISGAFQLSVTEKWAQDQKPWKIVPGNECVLSVNKEDLITGYVDSVKPSYDKGSRSISISGRDYTGDLVDCSAVHKPGNWANISLLRLAKIICEPFSISVSVADSASAVASIPFPNWNLQNETAFESLDRAAKLRGVLLMNDGKGNVLISRAGTEKAKTSLSQGENILSASADFEFKNRFSQYIVKGQAGGLESDNPLPDFSPIGYATDQAIERYRPSIIIAEGSATLSVCKARAQWEATVRAAKGSQLTVTIQGWRQADGSLWKLNQITRVKSPWLGVNQDFLISSLEFKKGSEGTLTVLELERPDAYTPDPTLSTRKEPLAQLVKQESSRK